MDRPGDRLVPTTLVFALALAPGVLAFFSRPAAAHVGALAGSSGGGTVPTWLTVLTGGVVVGASFLFTSLLTDHAAIRAVNRRRVRVPVPAVGRVLGRWAGAGIGTGGLLFVVVVGLLGPTEPRSNAAILVVWAGWWAGYTATTYLVGNTWDAIDPWRTVGRLLPSADRTYPERLGAWPSVAGLLLLVWVEVVSPLAADPRLLSLSVLGYSTVTLAGAAVYGPSVWFDRVDPIAGVFRTYGRIAPVQRTENGIELAPPAAALANRREPDSTDRVAFVVALLWATTYDGLVTTPFWTDLARPLVESGLPPLGLYLVVVVTGFLVFLAAYLAAARAARRTTRSYVSARFVAGWFAPALLPIAAGYHLAHFLGYLLTLAPALAAILAAPVSPPATVEVLVLPDWFGVLQVAFVLLGHLVAVWIAHALAVDLFPGRTAPIRSGYSFTFVMVAYTMLSVWIVTQPFAPPPGVT